MQLGILTRHELSVHLANLLFVQLAFSVHSWCTGTTVCNMVH